MLRQTLMRISQQQHIRDLAMRNGMAQSFSRRFVAGETIDEALQVVRDINARGMTATLDHLGENVTSLHEAREAATSYCTIVECIIQQNAACNVSLKLTQFGLDLGSDVALDNLRRVVEVAAAHDIFVRIDMEDSQYVDRTLEIFFSLHDEYKNVGVVLQSCLYRTKKDLEQVIDAKARVRLVKGAYLEPDTVAYQAKEDVDANFIRLAKTLLARGTYPAIATHDIAMIDAVQRYAREHAIEPSQYEFQMLFGIRRDLQSQLVGDRYNMRVYVPFGAYWYPYMMRRMAERPANVFFVIGSLAREVTAARRRNGF
ncbi:MAG: proline dehydrogenase [Chloroflexota bacterium]